MIISISGKIGSGKTTLAQHLQHILAQSHLFGMGVPVLRAFGDAIKVEASEIYGFPLDWAYSQTGKLKVVGTKTVRELLQKHGNERRQEDPLYWVKRFKADIALDNAQGNTIIVHDMRMPEEAQAIKDMDGILVRMEPYAGWTEGRHGGDITETALDDFQGWDYTFRPQFGKLPIVALRLARDFS